jgi:hypothetical protein
VKDIFTMLGDLTRTRAFLVRPTEINGQPGCVAYVSGRPPPH